MAKTFHLTIAQVGHNIFDGEAVSVTLPGSDGVFTVLANHEAFVTPLKIGEARVETQTEKSARLIFPSLESQKFLETKQP